MNGFVSIYKEKGMTSHDVVSRLRRILKTKKIGHGGTLDPNAEGVLVMGIGNGTRLLEYVVEGSKTYEGELVFGAVSDTEDIVGNVKEVSYSRPTLDDVQRVIAKLSGQVIEQVPPMYSSVKVDGKKLYEYARSGQEVERKARTISIEKMEVLGDFYEEDGFLRLRFLATVSKGTYIRTLCVAIGEMVGIPCIMGELLRVRVGFFALEESYRLETIERMMDAEDMSFLLPLKECFPKEDYYELMEEELRDLFFGKQLIAREEALEGSLIPCLYGGELVSLVRYIEGRLKVEKNMGGME